MKYKESIKIKMKELKKQAREELRSKLYFAVSGKCISDISSEHAVDSILKVIDGQPQNILDLKIDEEGCHNDTIAELHQKEKEIREVLKSVESVADLTECKLTERSLRELLTKHKEG